ncbi:MAG: type VI secretion system ATPase TssH [Desulfobacterales bacterium]|nr:type VI secretion system ATPase TssH [Desulfobacterales bacterium]
MSLDIQTLIEKLNPICRKGLEAAAEFCVSHTNYNVEIEHFFSRLIDVPDTDIQKLFRYYEIRTEDVNRDMTASVEKFRRGNSRTPALSPHILRLLEEAWLVSSLHFNTSVIRSGAILLALLDHDTLRGVIFESSPTLKQIPRNSLKNDITEIIKTSGEHDSSGKTSEPLPPSDSGQPETSQPRKRSQTPDLDQYTIDLTERARNGHIDPIRGRDAEIRQLIDILTRRRQNNPILTGEAGVGKTAVAEGFALRIVKGDIPPSLKDISLRLLDLGLLQAGAGIKGEFEKRLKSVIDEVKNSVQPIILFIDEAHTMIGAGGPAGMGDAANLLKPALARGELRTIAATTWSEYKKYFEKDPALARRFQVVKVDEPDEEKAVEMLRGVAANLEAHHKVMILDEAIRDAVRLSHRYISGRLLPDKAISVLDTSCARVSVSQNTTPPNIEDLIRRAEQLELEIGILRKEEITGKDHAERISELERELNEARQEQEELEHRWQKEIELAKKIIELKKNLVAENSKELSQELDQAGELAVLEKELEDVHQGMPMVSTCVDSEIIATVISNWTGIPVGKMLTDEIGTILNMKEKLEERIIGQPQAMDSVCRRVRTYRADLDDPGKPVGVFLLVGSSGVGKTETAIALAEILYGGERNMVTVNMSEYQESYTVSGLKGSPPGYVGYGKGGVLTEAVRHRPYSVVLLDEVEKAHPDVMELFYQVFDKGKLEDSEGLTVDFKNTVILLTSNVASEIILESCRNPRKQPNAQVLTELIRPELLEYFKPALLGRLVIVPYYPLWYEDIQQIIRLKLEKIQKRFQENHRIELTYSDKLVTEVSDRCTESDTGARNVDNILTQTLLPELSGELLTRMAKGVNCTGIHIYMDSSGGFAFQFKEEERSDFEDDLIKPRFDMPFDFGLSSEKDEDEDIGKTGEDEEKSEKPGKWRRLFKRKKPSDNEDGDADER